MYRKPREIDFTTFASWRFSCTGLSCRVRLNMIRKSGTPEQRYASGGSNRVEGMDVRRKFSRWVGGQRCLFTYHFQVVDDVMQMDGHKTLYPS